MPIPIRSHSPSKAANLAGDGASTTGIAVPRKLPAAKEPARLTRDQNNGNPASLRATDVVSRPKPNDPRPKNATTSRAVGDSLIGHVRSQSAANATGARKGADSARVERFTSNSASQTQTSASARNRDPVRLPGSKSHTRALSTATRANTESRTANESFSAPKAIAVRPFSSRLPGPSASETAPRSFKKPDFDTFNQHYSPKKPSRPIPNHIHAPPSGASGTGLPTTEVANFQGELLQLSLVYGAAAATFHAYRESAKLQLSAELEDVNRELLNLRSLQDDRQAKHNAIALSKWFEQDHQDLALAGSGAGTLLILGHCIKELDEVNKDNGPLENAMRTFDEWHIYASSRNTTRTIGGHAGRDSKRCLVPIDPQWSALVSSVQDRAKACAASLADLPELPESSSIGRLIKVHLMLADHIQQEIELCRDVERLILQREQSWVETSTRRALANVEGQRRAETSSATHRKGLWET